MREREDKALASRAFASTIQKTRSRYRFDATRGLPPEAVNENALDGNPLMPPRICGEFSLIG